MMITGQKDKNEYKITKSEFTEKIYEVNIN